MAKEAKARIKINHLLEKAGWRFDDSPAGRANIELEAKTKLNEDWGEDFENTKNGFIDYLLLDGHRPICVLEAKRESLHPLIGKEQARDYAKSKNCPFVLLSNGVSHYFWEIKRDEPQQIPEFPSPLSLEERKDYDPNPQDLASAEVAENYLAGRTLRDYQMEAIHAVQQAATEGKTRFLLEMATGTGKTTIAAALCKLFLETGNARRILFLVDRIELENQAERSFSKMFKDQYFVRKYKGGDWRGGRIVVSTVQSLLANNRYRADFLPFDFDLVISDEAHRSLGGVSRAVFEYFLGYKLGLTATPRDYLKGVDGETLPKKNLKEWERRNLSDTYNTFHCAGGEPTFRYDLNKGVQKGVLIKPRVLDARTDITTQLFSEKGYAIQTDDGDGAETAIYYAKAFEKIFRNDNSNRVFCETLIKNGLRDPISGEFGKMLVFCVRRNHAAQITNMLNKCARAMLGYTDSDFAVQITSEVTGAQLFAKNFANNRLNGKSKKEEKDYPDYETSKTRVCVTVGMMTTGYDCPDLLNIALLRPIFSPSDFIQMKGRGTRKHTFEYKETGEKKEKTEFLLFDFFANYEYFEKDFNYDKKLELLSPSEESDENAPGEDKPAPPPSVEDETPDKIVSEAHITVGNEGMKIDRTLSPHEQFESVIRNSETIKRIYEEEKADGVAEYIKAEVFHSPTEYWTAQKIRTSYEKQYKLDRKINLLEMVKKALKITDDFQSRAERIDELFQRFIDTRKPNIPPEQGGHAAAALKSFFETYMSDRNFREIIDKREFGLLTTYAEFSMEDLEKTGDLLRKITTEYINEYLQSEMAEFDWKAAA